jgi:hypothetical protein
LCHTCRAGRPKHAKSTSSTAGWSFIHAGVAHTAQRGRSERVSNVHDDRVTALVDAEHVDRRQAHQ